MPEIRVIADSARAGAGLMPVSEPRRAWLPQHARFCPVIEDGSRMGLLVYPPLFEGESYQVAYIDDGHYELTFFRARQPVFTFASKPSGGGGGTGLSELVRFDEHGGVPREEVAKLAASLVINLHTPIGGVGLRGSHDFATPEGWDTIYSGVLNDVRRPATPSLTVRVETDWFRQPTEFRYVLQKGDSISAEAHTPVGQVTFVSREEVTLTLASDEEAVQFELERREYWARKPEYERYTAYGSPNDRQYQQERRGRRAAASEAGATAED